MPGLEPFLERVERLDHFRLQRIVDGLLLANRLQHAAVIRFDEGIELRSKRRTSQTSMSSRYRLLAGEDDQNLLFHRQRLNTDPA